MADTTALERYANVEMNSGVDISILTSGSDPTEKYASLADMFKNYTVALNEQIYNAMYLADSGFGSALVTGMNPTVNLTGDFNPKDEACAYFEGIQYKVGADRVSKLKLNRGTISLTVPVTITSIAIAGGDAGQPNSISVTLTFDGEPTISTRPANSSGSGSSDP